MWRLDLFRKAGSARLLHRLIQGHIEGLKCRRVGQDNSGIHMHENMA